MRVVIILLTIVVIVLSGVLAVRYNQKAFADRKSMEKERYKRIVGEESLDKANTRIGSLELELKRTQDKIKRGELLFRQTKAHNLNLKSRLVDTGKINTALEERISELENELQETMLTP